MSYNNGRWHNPMAVTPKGECQVVINRADLKAPRLPKGLSDGEYQRLIMTWKREREARLGKVSASAILAAG
jgi:hypothetical protein